MQTEQSPSTNAAQPRDVGRQIATTARQGAAGATQSKLRVAFSVKEAARLSGIPRTTLRDWCRNGWVPKFNDGLSAWTVLVLSILAATNRGKGHGAYLGDVAV